MIISTANPNDSFLFEKSIEKIIIVVNKFLFVIISSVVIMSLLIIGGVFFITPSNQSEHDFNQKVIIRHIVVSQPEKVRKVHGYDLGGKCREKGDGILSLPDLWDELEVAETAGDYEEAIEIRKRIILIGCDNEYFWAGLPALHIKMNDHKGAIAALEAMYKSRFLVVETFFDPIEAKEYFRCDEKAYILFKELKESNGFIYSNLASEMQENRIKHRQRINEALNKLNTLKESNKPP